MSDLHKQALVRVAKTIMVKCNELEDARSVSEAIIRYENADDNNAYQATILLYTAMHIAEYKISMNKAMEAMKNAG